MCQVLLIKLFRLLILHHTLSAEEIHAQFCFHTSSKLCDYALRMSNCNISGETVPIAARKQVVATWVQLKRLLQQQIGSKMDTDDEVLFSLSAQKQSVVINQCFGFLSSFQSTVHMTLHCSQYTGIFCIGLQLES